MAALAANAVKSQRRKAANKLAEQALSNINEQRQFLATVAQKHRDSLSSVSTLDSYRQYEVKKKSLLWFENTNLKKKIRFFCHFFLYYTLCQKFNFSPKIRF